MKLGRATVKAFLCLGLCLGAAGAGAPAWAQVKPAARAEAAQTYTFAFKDAEVASVAEEILGRSLGVTYVVDPEVTGKLSFRIDKRLTRVQLLEAFEAALAANGVVLVQEGQQLVLKPRAKAKTGGALRAPGERSGRGGYEVVAVPLSFASPTEIGKALEALAPANTVLFANDRLGLLVLGGTGSELEAALQTIRVFDQSGLEESRIRWFELEQAPAQTVASELERVLQGSGATGITIVPLKRLNGLFVFARTAQALEEVGRWIVKLDQAPKETAAALWVYHPLNLPAESLAQALNSVLYSGAQPIQPPTASSGPVPASASVAASAPLASPLAQPAAGEDAVRIGANRETNTLLISAPVAQRIQIQKLLGELDQPPRQILIEASILEVSLTNDLRFGVDWSAVTENGKLGFTLSGNSTGAIGPSNPGFSVTYLGGDFKAAISALGAKTDVQIVSAPKIVTLENKTARLQIGDQVPIITQSSVNTTAPGAPVVSAVDYRSTGVILSVTPRLSGEDNIVLEIVQEVSSVSSTSTSNIDSPTIKQRRMESTLKLGDGKVVALGGLISDQVIRGDSGLPLLKDIPLIGLAFKSTKRNTARTELIVLLTAKIMHDEAGATRTMGELLADMKEIQARGLVPAPR